MTRAHSFNLNPDPFTAFSSLADVDRLFRMVNRVWRDGAENRSASGTLLNAFVTNDEETFVVTTEVPGVESKDVEVQLVGDTITIAAKRVLDPPKDGRWLHRERSAQDERRVELRLTAAGRALCTRAGELPARMARLTGCSIDELSRLRRRLDALRTTITEAHGDAPVAAPRRSTPPPRTPAS
jgi:HSP20 family molecular chaperone IbpA